MKITATMHYKESSAEFSSDGIYRYRLSRAWAPIGPRVVVIGYNPSTADALVDDQTIRRLRQLLAANGYSGFEIVNLYAFRATDPKALDAIADPVGPGNDDAIAEAMANTTIAVIAWGAIGTTAPADGSWKPPDAPVRRRRWVLEQARRCNVAPLCFGFTKDGAPRHPSRLPRTAKLEAFR